ncbi:MAG: hypothetical protein ABI700_30160, partial [Chloroflexota bacterium]
MNTEKLRIGEKIRGDLLEFARLVVDQQYKVQPHLWERYGERGYQKCVEDTQAHLAYLAEAVSSDDVLLFVDYVRWAGEMLQAFNVPRDDFAANLLATRSVLEEHFSSEELLHLNTFLSAGLAVLTAELRAQHSYLDRHAPLGELALEYLDALLNADRKAASKLIMNEVAAGT